MTERNLELEQANKAAIQAAFDAGPPEPEAQSRSWPRASSGRSSATASPRIVEGTAFFDTTEFTAFWNRIAL